MAPSIGAGQRPSPPGGPEGPGAGEVLAGLAIVAVLGVAAVVGAAAAAWVANTVFVGAAMVGQGIANVLLGERLMRSAAGDGGGGGICDDLPDWVCGGGADTLNMVDPNNLPNGMWAFAMLFLFLGFLLYWLFLIFKSPLRLGWRHHASFKPYVKPSPYIGLFVAIASNSEYLQTLLGQALENQRMFASLCAAAAGFGYLALYAASAPLLVKQGALTLTLDKLPREIDRSRPIPRYLLVVLAYVQLINLGYVALSLLPGVLAIPFPDREWWCPAWPFGCSVAKSPAPLPEF